MDIEEWILRIISVMAIGSRLTFELLSTWWKLESSALRLREPQISLITWLCDMLLPWQSAQANKFC